ncbi:hypothetical protein WJX73_005925 [Symbiochloris irregularis]|uniref:glutathione transferase n=1 Tax=Symbiochloris irregularis TaxID=706552 RepID=A0AAW1PBZ5_9CHLO
MTVTVHHLDNSRSQRIIWLLEELEVQYEIKKYKRNPETFLAQDDLTKLHPMGKLPVITDDGFTIAESGAIVEYLVSQYGNGRLKPKDKKDWVQYVFWLHHAEGSAMLPMMERFHVRGSLPPEVADKMVSSFLQPELEKELDFVEGQLSKSDYLAGDTFSACDIHMTFVLQLAEVVEKSFAPKRPNLAAFMERVQSRPAYKRAIEKGDMRYELSDFSKGFY